LDDRGLAAFYQTLTPDTYVLIEATITTFSFARLFRDGVKEVIVANTYELKEIRAHRRCASRNNTDKIDADKLCRILKMQVVSGERIISPVTIPPAEIQSVVPCGELSGRCLPPIGCSRSKTPS
jgi:transposase